MFGRLNNILLCTSCSIFLLVSVVNSKGCQNNMDVLFVVDVSTKLSGLQFSILKQTLIHFSDELNVGNDGARMGVIAYSDSVSDEIRLTRNKKSLKKQIRKIKQGGNHINTTAGIEAMLNVFIDQYKVRGVPKVGVVILSDNSLDPGQAIQMSFQVKADGVIMHAISVSDSVKNMELMGIASDEHQNMYSFGNPSGLLTSSERVVTSLCNVPSFETSTSTTTTTSTTTAATTTTTTSTTSSPSTTTEHHQISTMAPIAGPCDDCKISNGVGFNPHPEDCDKFTQCYFGQNKQSLAVYRQCPFGQYWSQNSLTCMPASEVQCSKEKCALPGLLSYPYRTITNNRAYWQCFLGKSRGMCCPEGFRYKQYQGCEEYDGPSDPCPPTVHHEGSCDSRPIFDDLGSFEQYAPGHGWIKMPCAPGTHYNPADCQCSFHTSFIPGQKECKPEVYISFGNDTNDYSGKNVKIENHGVTVDGSGYGYFDGNSKLVIPRFANFETYSDFVVKMRYFHSPSDRLEALFSNGDDCCDHVPSVAVVKSRRNIHYMAKCDNDKVTTFHTPAMPGNWNEVYYVHDGYKLEGRNNGILYEDWAVGKLQKSKAGLQIGHGRLFQNFKGYMDYVAIYLCRPSYL